MLRESTDALGLDNSAWTLARLMEGGTDTTPRAERLQAVLDAGVMPKLVELLDEHHACANEGALRACGNAVESSDEHTQVRRPPTHLTTSHLTSRTSHLASHPRPASQVALDAGLLPALVALLRSGPPKLREPVTFHLSNIASGTPPQLRRLIDAGAYPPVLRLLSNATEGQVATNCAYTIVNALQGGGATIAAELVTLARWRRWWPVGKSSAPTSSARHRRPPPVLDAEGASPLSAIEAKHTAAAVAAAPRRPRGGGAVGGARRRDQRGQGGVRRRRCCRSASDSRARVGAQPHADGATRARARAHGHAAYLRASPPPTAATAVGAAVGRRGAHHTHSRGGAGPTDASSLLQNGAHPSPPTRAAGRRRGGGGGAAAGRRVVLHGAARGGARRPRAVLPAAPRCGRAD